MLIIDLKNKRVNQAISDPDVVIIKGATKDLISTLAKLTITTGTEAVSCSTQKVPLASQCCNSTFVAPSYGCSTTKVASQGQKVFKKAQKTRQQLQQAIAEALTGNDKFIAELRQAVEGNGTLNPLANFPTTKNILAAAALYAYYSDDTSFASTEGSEKIAKQVQVSPDVITRLANDFTILSRKGLSTATRYAVRPAFANVLIRVLQNTKYRSLLNEVDALQDQLDACGSLK